MKGDGLIPTRWTSKRKQVLYESRIQAASALIEAVRSAANKPAVFIQSSAIGYYGPHADEALDENSSPGSDFLARLCVDWEASSQPI